MALLRNDTLRWPIDAMGAMLLASVLTGCMHAPEQAAGPDERVPDPVRTTPSNDANLARDARLAAWHQLGFGMFVHWGLYSELGGMWQGKPVTSGYSEQIQGWANISDADYAKVAAGFAAPRFDADAICALAKQAGARYIVVTSKHHDGFAMFDTATTDYDIVDRTPFGKDPMLLLSQACRKIGIGFGVYFSLVDWHAGHTPETRHNSNPIPAKMEPLIEAQLRELMTHYGPIAEVWFDMSAPTPEQSRKFEDVVHSLQPQVAINGRIWNNAGDFVTLGDNESPPASMLPPFQVPASIYHATWGYRSWQQRSDLPGKVRELTRGLVRARAAGGNYLLNIGPMGDGGVVPFEADVLRGIGAWLRRHPHTLDAAPAGLPPQSWGQIMRDGQTLQLFVDPWGPGELRVVGFAGTPADVRVANGDPLKWRRDGNDLLIDLPAHSPDPVLPVLHIVLSGPLQAVPPLTVAAASDGEWRIAFEQWRAGTRFAFGSGYRAQTTSTVQLNANIEASRPAYATLQLTGARAHEKRRYLLSVAGNTIDVSGAQLASSVLGPFALPAGPAVPLQIRLANPAYSAEHLGLHFDSVVLKPAQAPTL